MAFTSFHDANTPIMACQHDIMETGRDMDSEFSL